MTVLVLAVSTDAWRSVAGLPLALRAVLELRGAGVEQVTVLAGPMTPPVRAGFEAAAPGVSWLESATDLHERRSPGSVLVVDGAVLVDGEALAPLLRELRSGAPSGVVALTRDTGTVAAVLYPAPVVRRVVEALAAGTLRPGTMLAGPGAGSPQCLTLERGLAVARAGVRATGALEAALFAHLATRTARGDSYLAVLIERRLSRPLTRLLLRTTLHPSQITLVSVLVGLGGAAGLATVSYGARVWGVLALVASAVLDCVDGEVARARCQQTAAGARLDVAGDYVIHLAVFAGLALGLFRQGISSGGGWAALALIAGIAAAMTTMHLLFVRPALRNDGQLHGPADAVPLRQTPVTIAAWKLASRDYTYLLLVLALVGRLEWFLYAAAAGSWLFVVGILGHHLHTLPARRRAVASS